MLLRTLGAFALALPTAAAFQDASPFFMFSTSELVDSSLDGSQLVPAPHVGDAILDSLGRCPSDAYIVVSQPGVSSSDYKERLSAPHLRQSLGRENRAVKSTLLIPEVYPAVSTDGFLKRLELDCKACSTELDARTGYISTKDKFPQIIKVNFPALPSVAAERASKLAEHDSFLNAVISSLHNQSYTVVYTTTPPSDGTAAASGHQAPTYEMDDPFPSALHTDLKRDVSSYRTNNTQLDSNLPLFEKYQFLSTGIFMGLLVSVVLFLILYVGISAIANLEVSYFAFSREMGPAAQRKQQ